MAIGDKKKLAVAIVGKGSVPSTAPDMTGHMPMEDGGDMGSLSAAEELMAAVQAGDASGVASAMRSFYDIWMSRGEESEEEVE